MHIERKAKSTITPVEMNHGDVLLFTTTDGVQHKIHLQSTCACRLEEIYDKSGIKPAAAKGAYRFWTRLVIDGYELDVNRYVGTQDSFYEPWVFNGIRFWFDATEEIFQIMNEDHGKCKPSKHARFIFQDAKLSICPAKLKSWCPLPPAGLQITDCYRGEDCWLGPYDGCSAHAGLDINHPAGTPLWAPIDLDDHYLFNSKARNDNNNRWIGIKKWEDGSEWILKTSHVIRLIVPEHTKLKAGTHYADGGGVAVCYREHTHFGFEIKEFGETYTLDPWIFFWQIYRDEKILLE